MTDRSGYTLVEFLVFIAITAVVAVAFAGILIITVQLQAKQASSGQVQTESTALLQQVQYYVQNAALVNIPVDTPTSTLSLRMGAGAQDPTTITLVGGVVYVTQGTSTAQPLTSNRVTISNLMFTRHANPPAHDSVNLTFTASANTQNLEQMFSQAFQTTVTQVSAASFDSNIVPSSTNTYSLGTSGAVWSNINGVVYFSGSRVGIGTSNPLAPLDVTGGDLFLDSTGTAVTLRDVSGGCWKVTVSTGGALQTATTSCSTP